jgi:hypothetical protein
MNLIFELHPNLQWHCGSVSEGKSCLRLTDTIATLPNGYQLMDGRLRAASGHRHSFPVCDQCAAKLRDAYTDEKIQLLNATRASEIVLHRRRTGIIASINISLVNHYR